MRLTSTTGITILVNGLSVRVDRLKDIQKQRTKQWHLPELIQNEQTNEMTKESFESALISSIPIQEQESIRILIDEIDDSKEFAKKNI